RGAAVMTIAAVALPIAYCPTIFFGLNSQLHPSTYPPSWSAADAVAGAGTGQVLALPWHQYLAYPFSHGIVVNPTEFAFRREVIPPDDVELPGIHSAST